MVMEEGFLAIDVLARPHRHDGRQRVPAVAGGDQDGVEVRALGQELANVAVHGAVLFPYFVSTKFLTALAPAAVGVADRQELHVRFVEHLAQHGLAPAAQSDAAQQDALAGCRLAVLAQGPRRDQMRRGHHAGRGQVFFNQSRRVNRC